MPCSVPTQLSPGFIGLEYEHTTQGITHHSHLRLYVGENPADFLSMRALADGWAAAIKGVFTSNFTSVGFFTQRLDGTHILSGSLTSPVVGTHGVASGALDYCSRTVTFTGRGIPPVAADCVGEALSRVFVGAAYEFIARQKVIVAGADAGCDAYRSWLDTNGQAWADFYGHGAQSRGTFPVQFNAYFQRKYGT